MKNRAAQDPGSNLLVRHHFLPGDVGAIVYLHGKLYFEEYGFDHTFEPYVAIPLSEFVRSKTDREQIWIVEKNGEVKGSLAIVACSKDQAQLRWLLLHPDLRGTGTGKRLVTEALAFCRAKGYGSVFLWTVRGLAAATKIYRRAGFLLTETATHRIWGQKLTEERYEQHLGEPSPCRPV